MLSDRIIAWSLAFALAFFPVLASAQSPIKAFPPGTFQSRGAVDAASGGGYAGPCDSIAGAKAAFGFLACSAAYATAHSPAADICDQATALVCTTINFLSTGYWDAATAAASSSCAVACVVTKFYDSTGNGNDAPANSSRYGLVIFNALGNCSAITQSASYGSSPEYRTATFTAIPQPYSLASVGKRTGSFTTTQSTIGDVSGGIITGFSNSASTAQAYFGGSPFTQAATDSAYHTIIAIGNPTSSLSVDGAAPATSAGAGTNSMGQIMYGSDGFTEALIAAQAVMGVFYPSAITIATMNTKLHSLCGGW